MLLGTIELLVLKRLSRGPMHGYGSVLLLSAAGIYAMMSFTVARR